MAKALGMIAGCLTSGVLLAGCDPECAAALSPRVEALERSAWEKSVWISVPDAPAVYGAVTDGSRAADGTSWFATTVTNGQAVVAAKWMVTGLGVFNVYVNGKLVGGDFLKPGFTHNEKTKYAFTYDVTKLLDGAKGAENALAAEVSAGWWRDKVCSPASQTGFVGKKSAFRGVLQLTYADGSKQVLGTNQSDWKAGVAGPVTHAAIYDGEEYDARVACPFRGEGLILSPEANLEFRGEILPAAGAEVCLRHDLALAPVETYSWKGTVDANGPWTNPTPYCARTEESNQVYGKVMKTKVYDGDDRSYVRPGETLVVDFGQNAAAVPLFRFKARAGTVLTVLYGEMLNDGNGERARGNDGPAGSLYRENLRTYTMGMKTVYTFAGTGVETYLPRYTYFGYRYLSLTATDEVEIDTVRSIPVSSIRKEMETGRLETGDEDVNRLVANIYWGQLSNYLSIPTDCPQRDERLGWTADTQIFAEAGAFNADTSLFLRKWMRDLADTQHPQGGYPGVAPLGEYCSDVSMRVGWSDAGIIVPYRMWCHFGDDKIVADHWASMERYMKRVAETKYRHEAIEKECGNYQWADWLSFEKLESAGGAGRPQNSAFETVDGAKVPKKEALIYWDYLGGAYGLWDAQMMAAMAKAIGRDAAKYEALAAELRAYMKLRFFATEDGRILPVFREMQTPAVLALNLGLVEGRARELTVRALRENVAVNKGCLQTGFLGTSLLMDTLTENGMSDLAYDILLNHGFPGWLYSVDQGATTVWERWNSYTKETGFGPVVMNSFNHYAYGCVLAWLYKSAAGIASDPVHPGFRNIVMKPVPDRRIGHVTASYRSVAGLVKSAWRFEGERWIWDFTIPKGSTADVILPGEKEAKRYAAGSFHVEKLLR